MFRSIFFVFVLAIIRANSQPVSVELYFESLCPDCKEFIANQLYPTWETLQQTGIVTFTLYPYGNARQSILPNGMWDFKCQHGPTECHLNLVEACILQSVDFDESIYLPAINCIEKSTDPVSSAKDCVQNFLPNVPWEEITKCVEGPEGNAWMHVIGNITDHLDPPHNFVPWVVINGKHDDEIQRQSEENLLKLVCNTYFGEKPAECKNTERYHDQMDEHLFESILIEMLN